VDVWTILSDIVILLAASLLLGGVFSALGQSPLVGYLLGGMILGGPGSVHAVRSTQEIEAIAELGVALLLFSLGLEFSLTRLKQLGAKPLLAGVVQVGLTVVLGAGGAAIFGLGFVSSIAFGIMISLSSTAIVLRMLSERGELEMPHGRNSLAVLLTQDVAVVPLALAMTLLGGGGGFFESLIEVGRLVLVAALFIVGMYVVNRVAELALGTLTLLRNRELTVIFAVVTGLGSAWAAHAAGISPALGAFVAGMFLGSSAFATQIRADVSSLRVVLLTLFFGAAGMVADPVWIVKNWYLVAFVALLVTVGKACIIQIIFRMLDHTSRVATATGVCLAQVGEFAFVLGSIGRANEVISADLYALVVSVAIVSFVASAWLVPAAPRLGHLLATLWRHKPTGLDEADRSDQTPDVVFIGYGPAGQVAAQPFLDRGRRVVVIDLNRDGVNRACESGFSGQIGDATQREVLEHVPVASAKAVVITVPHAQSAQTILEHVRQQAPHAHVVVRSRLHLHSDALLAAGAHAVVGDEEEVGAALADHLRRWLASSQDAEPTRVEPKR